VTSQNVFFNVPERHAALGALAIKQQQLKYSRTHTKRNGDTLYIDLNNNCSQLICARLYKYNYSNTNFVHNCPFQFWTLRFVGPLDSHGPGAAHRLHSSLVGPATSCTSTN